MKKVGITGGIGSGKTSACKVFEALGVPVYYADERAKELYSLAEVKEQVVEYFGEEAYLPDGSLNSTYLSNRIFTDIHAKEKISEIIHPAVGKDFEKWTEARTSHNYVLKEAAIMVETGQHKLLDALIVVTAPLEIRLARVQKRSGLSESEFLARVSNQISDEERNSAAQYLIDNSGRQPLIKQVFQIHQSLLGR
jgi:dephospho-CoA kinase